MKTLLFYTMALSSVLCRPNLVQARSLSPSEVQSLLKGLASCPAETWMSTGTVTGTVIEESWPAYDYTDREISSRVASEMESFEANPPASFVDAQYLFDHWEAIPYNVRYCYRASSRMEERFQIHLDHEKFRWQTNLVRFQDLMAVRDDAIVPYHLTSEDERFFARRRPPAHASRRFNPDWNQQNTVAWDGQEFLIHNYSPKHLINHAHRQVTPVLPCARPAPLTAGLIPWGKGIYSLENLTQATVTGTETRVDGLPRTELVIHNGIGSSRVRVTAAWVPKTTPQGRPAHALVASEVLRGDQWALSVSLSGHIWLENRWVPTQIVSEHPRVRYGAERRVRETFLLEFHPGQENGHDMRPSMKDAWVEYQAPGMPDPLRYQMSETLDSELLLQEKMGLMLAASEGRERVPRHNMNPGPSQNCATLALGYAARSLGRPIVEKELASSVDSTGKTSLADLQRLARRRGLHCEIIQTDIDSLALLPACQIILYLPDEGHFALLGDVDTFDVWLIDFQKNTFLYALNKHKFTAQWAEGVALVLSEQSLAFPSHLHIKSLPHSRLVNTRGGLSYDCTKLIQNGHIHDVPCPVDPPCHGMEEDYAWIWGCEPSETGQCTSFTQWAKKQANCTPSGANPGECTAGRVTVVYYEYGCY